MEDKILKVQDNTGDRINVVCNSKTDAYKGCRKTLAESSLVNERG